MNKQILSQQITPVLSGRYNQLLKTATYGVKQCEFLSLRGFKPRYKWWRQS